MGILLLLNLTILYDYVNKKMGKIKVYVRKLFKLKNDGKKEERQCTLKGQAWYVNVRGSVHWKGVYRVGDRDPNL